MLDKNTKYSPYLIVTASVISAALICSVYLYTRDGQNKPVPGQISMFDILGFPSFGMIDVFFTVLITVAGFLLVRELITWYWKINRVIELLEKIEENTRK